MEEYARLLKWKDFSNFHRKSLLIKFPVNERLIMLLMPTEVLIVLDLNQSSEKFFKMSLPFLVNLKAVFNYFFLDNNKKSDVIFLFQIFLFFSH